MNHELGNSEANDVDRWIDSLLHSETAKQLESPPSALVDSIHAVANRRRPQRRFIACGLAAAALMIAVGWIAMEMPSGNRIDAHALNDVASAAEIAATSPSPSLKGKGIAEPTRATFVGGPDVIAVPVASPHSNVTVVRVYATFQSVDTSPQVTDYATATGEDLWSDLHNGG